MQRQGILWLGAGVLLAGSLAACGDPAGGPAAAEAATPANRSAGSSPAEEDEGPAIAVGIDSVRREALSALYSTSATLRADKRATVTARTSGVIRELLVEEGDPVQADQPLARLENEEQTIAFARARAARDTLQRDFERMARLHEQGLVSDEEYETVRREFQDAEHGAALAELELSRTVIRAPFAGVVLVRHQDSGATVGDGTPVYDIADLTPLHADVNVPERHVLALRNGQEVRMTVDASGQVLSAVIERIAPVVDPATGTVKVTLAVPASGSARPGAFVRADIVTDTHADATVVPRPALVAEGRRWHLYRLVEENRVEQLEVRLGFEEGDRVEILEVLGDHQPLSLGTSIVVAGAPALTDGARVRVIDP